MTYPHEWPAERTEELRKQHAAGLSFSKLAAMFGVTVGSIAGKCFRLKLARTGNDYAAAGRIGGKMSARVRRANAKIRRESQLNFTRKSPAILPRVEKTAWVSVPPPDAPPSLNLSIIDVGFGQCRHIAGDDHLCCGRPTVGTSSWCDYHLGRVYWRP
jgi:hypothetical protein